MHFEKLNDFKVELNNRIFVNRTLNLKSIKMIGFDMDYTLVLYNETELEGLAFEKAIDYLIENNKYPAVLKTLKFSADKIIRGLVIDKKLGNLVKINRFGYIKAALHGDRVYSFEEQKDIYSDEIVTFSSSTTSPGRYEMVHTMFSLAMCSLFCQLVDRKDVGKSYEDLYSDISNSMDRIHSNGTLKEKILADPARYVIRDPAYAQTLKMLRAFGKKLSLITNSEWYFTQAVMSYCYNEFLEPGETWEKLFEVIVVGASKPGFFTAMNKFFQVIPETGFLKNVTSGIELKKIYQGGNASGIEKLFNLGSSDILYVGDHIYSDVYLSKKASRWRTMLVITELDEELHAAAEGSECLDQVTKLMDKKELLELKLDQLAKMRSGGFSMVKEIANMDDLQLGNVNNEIRDQIGMIDQELGKLIESYNARFNPYWGELMWAGNDQSHFGMIIQRFACMYGSKVSNLLYYSPNHYFRPKSKSAM